MINKTGILLLAGLLTLISCSKDLDENDILAFSNEKQILEFAFEQESNASLFSDRSATINQDNNTIRVNVSEEAEVTNLIPRILISENAVVSPASGLAQDFTNPVTYTVTAEDKSTIDYTITVNLLNNEKQITAFRFLGSENAAIDEDYEAIIDQEEKMISLVLPYDTNIKTLQPVIEISPQITITPDPKSTQDFTDPVTYTLTAPDGSSIDYNVVVTLPEMSEREALIAMYKNSTQEAQDRLNWDLDATDMNSWKYITAENGKITKLHVDGSAQIAVSSDIKNLINLESFSVAFTSIELPKELIDLPKLTGLSGGYTETEIPDWIDQLQNLENFGMAFTSSVTPEKIEKILTLKKLKSISLSFAGIIELPESIGALKSLEKLFLIGNELTALPSSINQLSQLIELRINDNNFVNFPDVINNLNNLETLFIYNNEISSIPSDFFINKSNLKSFVASQCKLSSIPAEIGNLTSVEWINFGDNEIVEIPKEIQNLKNLKTLDVKGNQIQNVPDEIRNLENLESLNLSGNKITTISRRIGSLKKLTTLNLGNNEFLQVPSEIGDLTALESLILNNNSLTSLPSQVGKLIQLKSLNVSGNNNLTSIPQSVCDLENTGTQIIKDAGVVCQ